MDTDRLCDLLDQAVKLESPEQLADFLQRHLGDSQTQQQELLGLVEAHRRSNRLLDNPTEAMRLLTNSPAESEGELIGNYKLLQKIGEGGMGIVFMAEQLQPIRRKVALKVIREGINSKQILARFEAEREALARLDHPNATRILDAGVTAHGRPFFVMELVRGTHITDYCNTQRLTVNQRLELLEKVCLVIHHAHQKGILHRDIKPSNVMITLHDGVPVPKVIDFGIAKAFDRPLTEQTLFTRYGDLIGTPEYMSPEQAEMSGLDLDVRTDIYSLGVLLFELLTGSTPLTNEQIKGKGLLQIIETIRDSEAELPSSRITKSVSAGETIAGQRLSTPHQLRKSLVGDLDWITLKALAKQRNERYDSAASLAKDIRNYLEGEPVEAAAPTLAYRLRKFYRKHRTLSIVGTVSMFLLLVSTAFSAYWAVVSASNEKIASVKSALLEEKSAELQHALSRALEAEKKAEALARAESLRAIEARAQVALARHIAAHAKNQFQDFLVGWRGAKPASEDSSQENVEAKLKFMLSRIAAESEFPTDLSSIQLRADGLQPDDETPVKKSPTEPSTSAELKPGSSDDLIASLGVINIVDLRNPNQFAGGDLFLGDGFVNPVIYYGFLLEEQRQTLGNQDVCVAETLFQRTRSRIFQHQAIKQVELDADQRPTKAASEAKTPVVPPVDDSLQTASESVANENDLREALAILTDKPEFELQRLETAALLGYVLRAQNKHTQAAEFVTIATSLIQRLSPTASSDSDKLRIKRAQEYLNGVFETAL